MRPEVTEGGGVAGSDAEARFLQLYADHGRSVMGYAMRRVPGAEDAADLVAETFLSAWRRADEVPPGPEARLWLYGIARGLLANCRRAERRRDRLLSRLRVDRSTKTSSESEPEIETAVSRALGRLTDRDREILMLAGWEGLEPEEIARVLRISRVATRTRLHRARRRFEQALAETELEEDPPWRAASLEIEEAG
jgi:RNA polymerase sigma-70 factor (ECF subfamily)